MDNRAGVGSLKSQVSVQIASEPACTEGESLPESQARRTERNEWDPAGQVRRCGGVSEDAMRLQRPGSCDHKEESAHQSSLRSRFPTVGNPSLMDLEYI